MGHSDPARDRTELLRHVHRVVQRPRLGYPSVLDAPAENSVPVSFKRLSGSPALPERKDVPVRILEPRHPSAARSYPDAQVVLLQEGEALEQHSKLG